MKRTVFFLGIAFLILPLLFAGCSGNDGATGAAGLPGAPGAPGEPGTGVLANETCVICHAEDHLADVAVMHGLDGATGTVTVSNIAVTFTPNGDNVVTAVDFDFAATNSAGTALDPAILVTPSGSNLAYARFSVIRLVPGQVYATGNRDPEEWRTYAAEQRVASGLVHNGSGNYTYTFIDNTVRSADFNGAYTHRVSIRINGLPDVAAVANQTSDLVPDGSPVTVTRNVVTTAACNGCHNPLGIGKLGTSAFHGGARRETQYCVNCHNPTNWSGSYPATGRNGQLTVLVHKIHTAQAFTIRTSLRDFTEVTFPQDVRNCTKCHTGGANSDNWKTRPSREACGSCHADVNFDTGAGHTGGAQPDNRWCASCHPASDTSPATADITQVHLTEDRTPHNDNVPVGLATFAYFIDNVTVNDDVAVVTFHITKEVDNVVAPLDLSTYPPTGFTGGPGFLLAWALPQNGISAPTEYNNRNSPQAPSSSNGNGAGDAPSVSLASVAGSLTLVDDATKKYEVSLSAAPFPAGATMRAVAIQSYFTQTNVDVDGDGVNDSSGRHTPSVVKAVPGDAVRRQVVDWQNGCLACHETLQLHGGSRVNNTQVCVFCHNPNKSSSGRTLNPTNLSADVVAALGSDPLVYPEASNNFKELIHGIHRGSDRPYEFVRNRASGFYYNWSHVTFPGNLMACTKCHIGESYRPENVPAGALLSTERTTTGDSAETRAEVIAARGTVPNDTDLVNTPIASACYYCHDTTLVQSHIAVNGGKIRSEREYVVLSLTP